MKKITFLIFVSLISFCSYSQLALQDFEGTWPPANWLINDNGIGTSVSWAQGTGTAVQPGYNSTHPAYLKKEDVTAGLAADYLISPLFNVPAGGQLLFYSRLTMIGDQGSVYTIRLLPATMDETVLDNYVTIQTWTELALNPNQTAYIQKQVAIPAEYEGTQVRIAFVMEGDNQDGWLVDDVKVTEQCPEPENLTAGNITLTAADFSWDSPAGATQWEIEVIQETDSPTGTGDYYNGSLPYPATGLLENTDYKFYVRAKCDTEAFSNWAGPFSFSTPAVGTSCLAPLVIENLPYSTTNDTTNFDDVYNGVPGNSCGILNWEEYLDGNDAVYEYIPDADGIISVSVTGAVPFSGIFLFTDCDNIGTNCYEAAVLADDAGPLFIPQVNVTGGQPYYFIISTRWEAPTTAYTLTLQNVSCTPPSGLSAANISQVAAELSWANPGGASSWQVAIHEAGEGFPTGAGITAPAATYTASGLIASTAYEYYVRADCEDGTFSSWAGPYFFNTAICEPEQQCNYTFVMTDAWGDGWNGNVMNVTQNGITIATLTGPAASDGTNPVAVNVAVCDGLPIQLYWANESGSYTDDVGISIINAFDQILYSRPAAAMPNTQLYATMPDCAESACIAPGGVHLVSSEQAEAAIGWYGATGGAWEYYTVPAGSPAPTAATPGIATATNPAVVSGLSEATQYDFYIRMVCSPTTSSEWGGPFSFSTHSCPVEDQCNYTFVMTSLLWTGWAGDTMTISQNGAVVGVIGPDFTSGASKEVILSLCHDVPFEMYWAAGGFPAYVGISIVNSFGQTIYDKPFFNGVFNSIIYSGTPDCEVPACLPPTGLTATDIGMETTKLVWDNVTSVTWEYLVVDAGSPAPTADTPGVAASVNNAMVSGLTPATNYEYYVRLVCEEGDAPYTVWTGPFAFHTSVCEPSDQCMHTIVMTSQLGFGSGYNVMTVYQGGFPVATIGDTFDWETSTSVNLPLCPGEDIQLVWELEGSDPADIGVTIYTPFMEVVYSKPPGEGTPGTTLFTGLPSCEVPLCPAPYNLAVGDIELTSAQLSWTETGSSAQWEIQVLPMGSPAPAGPGEVVNDNPHPYEGLSPQTPYVFYVRANCGTTNGYSNWSGPFTFATAISNDECTGAQNIPVNNGLECGESISGTITGSSVSGIQPGCMDVMPDYDVWYTFVATSDTHSISITNVVGPDIYKSVYEGSDCGTLTEIACSGYATNIVTGLVPGTTYYLQVACSSFNILPFTSFDICIRVPSLPISVSDTEYTTEELVQDVLIGSDCTIISNITSTSGTDYGIPSIGYFNSNGSDFPFEEGIILATGSIMQAPRLSPAESSSDTDDWEGDSDLSALMAPFGNINDFYNATTLEFDFVPLTNRISFDFLFASNEYGLFQCDYSDAVAFILTGPDADGINLAVIPDTTVPVSVTSIRDTAYNSECPSEHPEYFGQYNIPDPISSSLAYAGETIVMQAGADVVQGQSYHMKIVIADYQDTGVNSAVFLAGGSFEAGEITLPDDMTIAGGNAICANGNVTVDTALDPDMYTFTWFKNDIELEGETASLLLIDEPGNYRVEAVYTGSVCILKGDIMVEFYAPIEDETETPADLTACDADGFSTFDLNATTEMILVGTTPGNYTVSYHLNDSDAVANANALTLSYENSTQYQQTLYARIYNTITECYAIASFELIVQDLTPEFTITGDMALCEGTSGTITVTPLNFETEDVTISWTKDGAALPDTSLSVIVNGMGTYEVKINNSGCSATALVAVIMVPVPIADAPADVMKCDNYILPGLSEGNSYYTQANGEGEELYPDDIIIDSQTIYVYAKTGTMPNICTDENSFMVTIVPTPEIAITKGCEGNEYVLEASFIDDIYTQDNVEVEWVNAAGTILGTDFSIVVSEPGIYTLSVTPDVLADCPAYTDVTVDDTTCVVPRGISPNNDGKNENFDLTGMDIKNISIFNRYGQKVYGYGNNYTNQWHGQSDNGEELPTGTYYYAIEHSGGKSTGWVYINREIK
jgi:gliding motility-associated-like protein